MFNEIIALVDTRYMELEGLRTYHFIITKDSDVVKAIKQYSDKANESVVDISEQIHNYFIPKGNGAMSYQALAYRFIEFYIEEHKIDMLGWRGLNGYKRLPLEARRITDKVLKDMP